MKKVEAQCVTKKGRWQTASTVSRCWQFLGLGLVIASLGIVVYLGFFDRASKQSVISRWEERHHVQKELNDPSIQTVSIQNVHSHNQEEVGSLTPSFRECSLQELVQKLITADTPGERYAISDALIAMGSEEAIRAWGEALLQENNPAMRKAMLEALDALTSETGVEMIAQLIELTDVPEIIDAVSHTLSRMANAETIKYLAEIYANASPGSTLQLHILSILGSITNPVAIPGLISIAKQPVLGAEVTGQAFMSLSEIGDPAALTAMIDAYDAIPPEDFAQRQQILQAIASITNSAASVLLKNLAVHSRQPLIASAASDALSNQDALPQELLEQ